MAMCFNFSSNGLTKKMVRLLQCKQLHSQVPVKEIQIPVKYGHLSAKLWGSSEVRPILALHGWQDNSGTWDPLIPMIIEDRSILALDFPGHGLSTWFPPGMVYTHWEFPRFILYLKEYFKWDKISIIAHSIGAISAMRYACVFNNDIDFFIAIDNILYDDYDTKQIIEKYPKLMRMHLFQQTFEKEPTTYAMDEIKQKWHTGSNKSVGLHNMQYLLNTGIKQSKQDSTKYYFTRDPRLKNLYIYLESKYLIESLVRRLICPMLYIKAIDSPYCSDQFAVAMRNIIEKNNPNFKFMFVPGTHHVHLNNPEVVAPLILDFLNKYNKIV